MSTPFKLTRIPTLKTVDDFRAHLQSLDLDLPCDSDLSTGQDSPLAQPVPSPSVNGKTIGNRLAIHPMEGWDGTTSGGITDEVRRRWQRFGQSGAKLIYGGEAMAVRPDGRANPNQLIITANHTRDLAQLVALLKQEHNKIYTTTDDLAVGFQLTHSGRFCRPHAKDRFEPRVAYRHPILDAKFHVTSDDQILSDDEVKRLIEAYIDAARVARDAGADFVDIKHCHGYLLHEFLGAHTRPGPYGGSFENRTRILREIIDGIRASNNPVEIGVRLSAFDFVPFKPDPERSQPGKLGPGIPEEFSHCLPYRYGFGVNVDRPVEPDLQETFAFAQLCRQLGVKLLNLSAGSPYYNPHIQRPAAYPPSDGYQPAHDPLIDVVRQLHTVRAVKQSLQATAAGTESGMIVIGTGYSYLQEYLPHVAQAAVSQGWTDMVGLGRMVLSYPSFLADAMARGSVEKKKICRTFSDCTTAPRNGLISGCYPLDPYYGAKPESKKLKEIKKSSGV